MSSTHNAKKVVEDLDKRAEYSQRSSTLVFSLALDLLFPFVSFALALLAVIYRRNLQTDILSLFQTWIVALFLMTGPSILLRLTARFEKWRWIEPPEATLLIFLFFMVCGVLNIPGTFFGISAFTLLGIRDFFKKGPSHSWNTSQKPLLGWMALSILATLFIIYIFESGWDAHYLSLTYREEIYCGHANRDTVAHIAYASIFQTYHRFAAGIHGLTPLRYHLGSHLYFVAISNVLRTPLYFAYNFGHVIITIPLLFHTILRLFISQRLKKNSTQYLGVVTFLLFFLIFPLRFHLGNGPFAASYISESFTLSAVLIFIAMGILFRLYQETKVSGHSVQIPSWFLLIPFPIFVAYLSLVKVSTGYAVACMIGALFVSNIAQRKRNLFGFSALSAVLMVITYYFFAHIQRTAPFKWNSHFHDELPVGAIEYYLVYCSPFWILCALGVIGLSRSLSEGSRVYIKNWLAASVVVAIATWPLLHFVLNGAGYFYLILRWICTVGICAILSEFFANAGPKLRNSLVLTLFVLTFVLAALPNLGEHLHAFRDKISENVFPSNAGVRYKQDRVCRPDFIEALNEVDRTMPKDTMVYVAPGERALRDWPDGNWETLGKCENFPFILVSESRRPAVFGMERDIESCEFDELNMWLGSSHRQQYKDFYESKTNPSHERICEEVTRFNMKRYVQISLDDKLIRSEQKECL